MVKKFENMFTRFDTTHERDGQTDRLTDRRTDGQTTHDSICRAMHSVSRQKWVVDSSRSAIKVFILHSVT